MDAPPLNWFGTLRAAFVLLAGSFLVAVPVTWLRYSRTHLDNQAVDIIHHLIIADDLYETGGRDQAILGILSDYPAASHRLAAWSAPLFGGDILQAMRYAAFGTMLALLALPYVLLCRVFSPLPALVLLLGWHLVCFFLQVDGLNHFMWNGAYNYSRAVGTVAFWTALVALSTATGRPWSRFGAECLAVACACLALACHVAPGAVTFAMILAWQAAWWLRERTAARAAGFALTLAAAAGMVFGTSVWVFMVQSSASNGYLPVGPHPILLLWVPDLLAALGLYAVRLRRGFPADGEAGGLEMALAAALLALKMVVAGTVAPYAVKWIYFFTFPVAGLLSLLWAGRVSVPSVPAWSVRKWAALAVVLGGVFLFRWHTREAGASPVLRLADGRSKLLPEDRRPPAVCRGLREAAGELAGYFYFDPEQIHGSYYANVSALRVPLSRACEGYSALFEEGERLTPKACDTLGRSGFVGVALPEWADPDRDAPGLGPAVKVGRYWKCPLPARVVSGKRHE
jgi:hypothetical protein